MARLKFLVVSNGAREAIFAKRLAQDSVVYGFCSHLNPTICDACEKTGGTVTLGDTNDGKAIVQFAKKHAIDYVFVNNDNALACGVVDDLHNEGVRAIGPTKQGARIEWDKAYAMEVVAKLYPEITTEFALCSNDENLNQALDSFAQQSLEVVVKPLGLTGGKGVKVSGEHLKNRQEVFQYAQKLIAADGEVLLVEKLKGQEFTVMGLTDGVSVIASPATYDYPYRFAHNQGAGTGGMGCISDTQPHLPFMTPEQLTQCQNILQGVVSHFAQNKTHFNGVLNGGFFITDKGLRFMEFNARFGDPEAMNVLSVFEGSFAQLLVAIDEKRISSTPLNFVKKASVVKYLVCPSYPFSSSPIDFQLPVERIENEYPIELFFSAAQKVKGDSYQTVSSSRVVALVCVDDTIKKASQTINEAIEKYQDGSLDYRQDIGLEF